MEKFKMSNVNQIISKKLSYSFLSFFFGGGASEWYFISCFWGSMTPNFQQIEFFLISLFKKYASGNSSD